MAIINVTLNTENLIPVNGEYTFTTQFLVTGTETLSSNPNLPQNQVHTTSTITSEYEFPVTVADGNYNISNTTLRVLYKTKKIDKVLAPMTINCSVDCTALPIVNIAQVNSTTYTVTLSSASTQSYSWKIFNTSGTVVSSGTSNTTGATFNITTAALTTGSYTLELTGTSCKGKSARPFNVVNTLPNCTQGPTLLSILSKSSTELKFQFDGISVFGIAWRIKQGTSVLRNGEIKHTSIANPGDVTFSNSTPTINYAALSNGTYTFEIQGSTCTSSITSASFTLDSTPTPLAFQSGSPSVTGSADNYTMTVKINKTGVYNTVVLNSTNGTYYQNGNYNFTAGGSLVLNTLPVGTYIIKVGDIETTLVVQNTGGGSCTQGPTLVDVTASSQSGLQFLFDGQGITAITWRIKQSGNTVRTGVVYPTNNTPFITYNELSEGNYVLEIEGNNCSSPVSSSPFEIVNVPQGNNAGVIVTNVGNKYIGVINARFFKAVANPITGNIRLFYDELSTADGSGSTQVKGWLMGSELQEIKASDVAALRSSNGLALPDGNYDFYLYYFPTNVVSNFSQIKSNIGLVSGPQWPQYSKTAERVTIEIRTNATL